MEERRPVEMVRLEKPEEVFEVEQVFGRDAISVFPNMNKDEDPMEALKASIGAKRFVSESELEEMKKARGLSVEDGTTAPDRPLAEILAERKQAKQDAFDDQWKQMKTGKNRPLEPDELEFLEALAQREADEARRVQSQEQVDLEAYRQAVAAAAEAKAAAAAAGGTDDAGSTLPSESDPGLAQVSGRPGDEAAAGAAAGPGPGSTGGGGGTAVSTQAAARRVNSSSKVSSKPLLPVLKPVMKVKPKGAAAGGGAAADAGGQRDSKRPRLAGGTAAAAQQQPQQQQPEQSSPVGLAGLLGGYASDSD